MNLDWITDPAWWALFIALLSAILSGISARAASRNARISEADALVCRVKLELTPAHGDDFFHEEHGARRGRLTNRGEEVAFDVAINREASQVQVEEFLGRTLNKGESIEFTLHPPLLIGEDPNYPQAGLPQSYGNSGVFHKLYFTFRRPEGLGGEIVTRDFVYEEAFGLPGDHR